MGDSLVQGAPLGGLGVRGGARRRRLDGAGGSTAEENDGGVTPVRIGRREASDQLREGEADLVAGSARAEEGRSYEFHCGQAVAELGLDCEGASVSSGRDGVARELCGDEAE